MALLNDEDILCDWYVVLCNDRCNGQVWYILICVLSRDDMDLRSLAAPAAVVHDEQPMTPDEERKSTNLCNIGDFVTMKSDLTITPAQRFWVGQVMNICHSSVIPDINVSDPMDTPNTTRWVKIWWHEAKVEYGKYKKAFHSLQSGQKERSMSWDYEEHVICKLPDGLNRNGTIKAYQNYRKRVEYDIKKACGELEGQEEVDYVLTDGVTVSMAKDLIGRRVKSDDGSGDEMVGMVTDIRQPRDDDEFDQRIHFVIQLDNDSEECIPYVDLEPCLIEED